MEPHSALANEGARRIAGRLIGGLIVAGAAIAVVVTLLQWSTRPQTDDATVRANFVGIAPQVSGHIVELRVRDNQQVREGDVLFVIDPRPYEIALARARAALALTGKEVEGYRRGVATADAAITRAGAQLHASAAADANLAATRAQHAAAEAALQQSKSERARADEAVGQVADTNARIAAAEAAVHAAELDLEFTRVRAPFSGRLVNLNISPGAFAR